MRVRSRDREDMWVMKQKQGYGGVTRSLGGRVVTWQVAAYMGKHECLELLLQKHTLFPEDEASPAYTAAALISHQS